tara:strand:+ start:138 stop:419 length:282 start_codon:yes stop_codon:yes gene_type:complete
MKKVLVILTTIILFSACKDEKLEALEKQIKETECILEFKKSLLGATNTILLGNKLGGKKDYEGYLKIQADTTTTCLELKDAWRNYNNAIDKLR